VALANIDYRNFSEKGPVYSAVAAAGRWWDKDRNSEEIPGAVTWTLRQIESAQSARLTQLQTSARLYGNVSLMGLMGLSQSPTSAIQPASRERLTYNVVQSAADTVTAKMAKNKPRPMFLTSGGDYRAQRKARKLNQYCDGLFYENRTRRLGPVIFRDAAILGDGIVKVFEKNGRVKHERVMATELWVDELEAFYGEPRQMHQVRNVDRRVLAASFKSKKADIFRASLANQSTPTWQQSTSDLVTVRESWHLPSGPDAKDGRHVITIHDTVLLDESWDKPYFPFARFRWCPRLWGFWSQGLAEEIQSIQLEINKLLWVLQRSYHLAGSFKILMDKGSKIVTEHLNNDIGAVIKYSGSPPQYVVPPVVPVEIYQHLANLIQRAFEIAGISMLSAVSKKPAGLNSGKALREYNDIESDRFMTIGQAYEEFHLDLARLSIAVARDIAKENGGDLEVSAPGNRYVTRVKWEDVDLEEDQYVMQAFPVSSLPHEPAGRMQTVTEMVQAGWLTQRQGKRLLEFPDLEAVEGLQSAAEDFLMDKLDKMVDKGEAYTPEPYDDLQLALELGLEYYQRGKLQGLEEERLDMLRVFVEDVKTKMAAANPPPPPPPGGTPTASPEAPPTSPLVSNVPQQTLQP